ncbi:Mu transposase domain-containing protein [Streptomyces luteogriseus]|uniref:Mu transposase domain-containing protein n=1 Tax=Streptomyces luteogriseus TaxID=68233 RepID=UPI00368A5A80
MSEYFAVERPLLQPLPDEPFETGRLFSLRVDRFSQISVRTNRYSVPVRLIGRTVRVMLHASELVVYDGQQEVARHERLIAKGRPGLIWTTTWRRWSASPVRFPGPPPLNRPVPQGSSRRFMTAWWEAAKAAHGERDGTRALIEVLLMGRHVSHELLVAGLASALRAGALTADAVALEARKAAEADEVAAPVVPAEPDRTNVTLLTERRLAQLPPDARPLPSVAAYDQLLRVRKPADRPALQKEMP